MISETAEPKNNRRGSVRPFRTAAALLILSAVLVSSFAVLSDSNESRAAVVIDGLQYELDDESSTAALVGYTNITGALSIPSAVTFEETEYTVTSIGEKAFNDCDTITQVSIPDSVTSIRDFAFAQCSGLTVINMGNGVADIGMQAFYLCTSLVSVTLSENLRSLGTGVFLDCSSLISVTLPASLQSISNLPFSGCTGLATIEVSPDNANFSAADGVLLSKDGGTLIEYPLGKTDSDYTLPATVRIVSESAFQGCTFLRSVTISDGTVQIREGAFRYCQSLESVSIPDSVENIDAGAFRECSSLRSLDLPNGIRTVKVDLLRDCPSLERVTIPDSVTSLERYAFAWCTSLRSVELPANLTSLGAGTFFMCTSLEHVTIPAKVTDIGISAFSRCASLTGIDVDADNPDYASADGVLFDKAMRDLLTYPAGRPDTEYAIPSGIDSIIDSAFSGCAHLRTFTQPQSLEYIGRNQFEKCPALSSVNIPGTVDEIAENAFRDCTALTTLTFSDGITTIGNGAFSGCTQLTSVTLPSTVTSLGNGIFQGCTSLGSVILSEGIPEIASNMFNYCPQLTSVTIPSSVKNIGDRAFYRCTSLESVTIPDGVGTVGDSAFSRCFSLDSVSFGKDVSSIQQNAFTKCPDITSYTVSPDNVRFSSADGVLFEKGETKMLFQYPAGKRNSDYVVPSDVSCIGDYAFYDATYLRVAILPADLIEIRPYAFYFCVSLSEIKIPAATAIIGQDAFYGCISLTSIEVDGANRNYSSADGVLFDKNIETLITYPAGLGGDYSIPDSVKTIMWDAFHMCKSLTGVTIPAGAELSELNDTPFLECISLASITVAEGNPEMKSVDGVLYTVDGKILITYPACKRGDSYTVPVDVELVLTGAFAFAFDLKSIDVDPQSVHYKSKAGALYDKGSPFTPDYSYEVLVAVPSGKISYAVPDMTYVQTYCFTGDRLTELSFGSETCVMPSIVYDCSSLQKITMKDDSSFTQLVQAMEVPFIVLNYGKLTIQIVCPEGYEIPDAATDNVKLVYYHPSPPTKNTMITAVLISLALLAMSTIVISAFLSRRKTERP